MRGNNPRLSRKLYVNLLRIKLRKKSDHPNVLWVIERRPIYDGIQSLSQKEKFLIEITKNKVCTHINQRIVISISIVIHNITENLVLISNTTYYLTK